MKKYGIGIIGCGNISDIYLTNITTKFDNLELIGIADLDSEKASIQMEKYNTTIYSTDELLDHRDIDIILNITTPKSHRLICQAALNAGKHVYVEKPLSLSLEDGEFLLALAKEKNLLIGGAPDTFLGAGIQTCRKLIQDNWIGNIIGCNAFMMCHGHESWHPDPEFYYEKGGGPMYDMGPYYLTALASLVGPVSTVAGMTSKGFDQRTITSEKKNGKVFDVEVPTHVTSLLQFEQGAIGYITTSFDVWEHTMPHIEIYGTKGTMIVPDPNNFGGPVKIMTKNDSGFKEIPLLFNYSENSRGLGLSKMAASLDHLEEHEANGNLMLHVLEVMEKIHQSWKTQSFMTIKNKF